ncbi:hypothetical protein JSY36_19835 [Bacillus sp. H-16]|uniref:hypothetical protein n=1 Tax=Alteribacter salitolerans TaxID=2912333 RepID=UPI001963B946|nr:hypothetical protein [Alteribacter salitolerans]MBM7097975.1 hypothetical protein [Alteribacter salitolerans]
MKKLIIILYLLFSACGFGNETMVLLEEEVKEVKVYRSGAVGTFSDQELMTFTKPESILIIEGAIRSAVTRSETPGEETPDYDLIISYGDDFPLHPVHLWLGEVGEASYFMYLVEGDEFYITSTEVTAELKTMLKREY